MSTLSAIATQADRLGLRPVIAKTASLAYRNHDFSVDEQGHWVNSQPECTIVSPNIHTTSFAAFHAWVLHHWTYCYVPKAGDVLIDVGSGVGEEAVIFSRLVGPKGKIIAIEAHPETFACLEQTVARSGLHNVVPLHCAVAEHDGVAEISDASTHLANSIVSGAGGQKVRQRSIDSISTEFGLDRIDFLRLNIEGAEKLAIRGMSDAVHRVQNICVSCHDFVAERTGDDTFRSKAEVLSFLQETGFKVTRRNPEAGRPWIGDYLYGSRN